MTKTKVGLQVRAGVKAGGFSKQHNRAVRVRAGIKAGGFSKQHNRAVRRA